MSKKDEDVKLAVAEKIGLGQVIEMQELQTVVIILFTLDTFVSLASLVIPNSKLTEGLWLVDATTRVLNYMNSFAVFCLSLEIFLVFISFGFRAILHFGYAADVRRNIFFAPSIHKFSLCTLASHHYYSINWRTDVIV